VLETARAAQPQRLPLRMPNVAAAGLHLTIRSKILLSLCVVIIVMGSINLALLVQALSVSQQYDAIITNIATANSISSVKTDIDSAMWAIVAGNTDFDSGNQYEVINSVTAKLRWLQEHSESSRAVTKLDVILRAMQTLTSNVDRMGQQMRDGSTAAANEALLEEIRFDSSVVEDLVHDYVLFEVQRTDTQYEQMHDGLARWAAVYVALTLCAIVFAVIAAWRISQSIYQPIKKLQDVTRTITRNDLQVLITSSNADEITQLGLSFNLMVGRIRELLEAKVSEQEELKKAELRALQAQINPHFLYNTLDAIVWMAESKKTDEVVQLVSALSNFFRISLSKGKDWITIREEIELTRNYLIIQKMRYRDIMDFSIDVDEAVSDSSVLKFTLQPLVENALYHGLKNRRQRGTIRVEARQKDEGDVLLQVRDDGIGMPPEKVAEISLGIEDEFDGIRTERGFGLVNVDKRIKLYYGKQYGLSLTSTSGRGTCVEIVIPRTSGASIGATS
jgi:two-component system sensor histidine kinase YesM